LVGRVSSADAEESPATPSELLGAHAELVEQHHLRVVEGLVDPDDGPLQRWRYLGGAPRGEDFAVEATVEELTPLRLKMIFYLWVDSCLEVLQVLLNHR
jgi:hypothetical protein